MHDTSIRPANRVFGAASLVVIATLWATAPLGIIHHADAEDATPGPEARASTAVSAWRPQIVDPGTDIFALQSGTADAGMPWTEDDARDLSNRPEVLGAQQGQLGRITVDYPLGDTVFPPDLCPPTFLWHDADERTSAWLIVVTFEHHPRKVTILTTGQRFYREIDPRCVTDTNHWTEPPYQASARGWTPDERTWSIMKQRSIERHATVALYGLAGMAAPVPGEPAGIDIEALRIVSRGNVRIMTSADPVGAPLFYRDVPLMPSLTVDGLVKPLTPDAVPLVEWRLRDVSRPAAPVVLRDLHTCGNCHSFSRNGDTLSMDMDGPSGDKGAHVVKAVSPHMVIEQEDVFSWNSFNADPTQPQRKQSFGLFPRVAPDGRYVVATVHESVHVQNYMDWQFLQTFYPTRGILAIFDRRTREIQALPGADDTAFVQSNAVWSPDGRELVFIRAKARDSYGKGGRAKFANDPRERQVQYDLYRIPFNEGRGGTATPIRGASANEMSNSFPKFSPDGRWLVFVQADNGLLLRPDSKLYIIPSEGGEARLMNCNTPRMNSWHSFSPNGRWMVFASKWPSPYTQMYLTHIDEQGNDTPAVLIPNSTAANRAVNLPEFAAISTGGLVDIRTPAADYRRYLDKADDLIEDRQFDAAIDELKRSLALRSNFAHTHYSYGNALSHSGQLDEAVEHYRQAVVCDPLHSKAHSDMGAALIRLNRPAEAVAVLAKSMQIDPGAADTHVKMGMAVGHLGRIRDATRHFRDAVELNPQLHLAQHELAKALAHTDQLDEALIHFAEAVRLDPDCAAAERDWGLTLSRLGRPAEALPHYQKAVTIDPEFGLARMTLGTAMQRWGRFPEAASHYAAAVDINPENREARRRLAMVLAAAPDDAVRDGALAVEHAQIACGQTQNSHAGSLLTLAAAQAETRKFDDAIDTAKRAEHIADQAGDNRTAETARQFLTQFEAGHPIRMSR